MRIGVTGSEGFIGSAVAAALALAGYEVRKLDHGLPPGDPGSGSILDPSATQKLCVGADGVIHLAAVSRVAHGEDNAKRCEQTNVQGTANILEAAASAGSRPWVLFSSSREVYGEPAAIPVREDAPIAPINAYGRSKARGEALCMEARAAGLAVGIVRFASVYGPGPDHPDRVVPAFARAAATGGDIRIDGEGNTFDFTHIDDVVAGVMATVELLRRGERSMPPVHLASGRGTTLLELAQMAIAASNRAPRLIIKPSLSFNVSKFVGDPTRAREILGWTARWSIEDGMRQAVLARLADAADH